MTSPATDGAVRSRLAGYCSSALAGALTSLTGMAFQVAAQTTVDAAAPETPIIWKQGLSLAEGAVLWMVAGRDLWEAVGEMILGGAGIDSVTEQDCRSTWNEITGQTISGIARALSADLGREVVAHAGGEDPELPAEQTPGTILEITGDQKTWHVRVAWSREVADACASPAGPGDGTAPASREACTSKTLDLLLDVALPVSVSFGRTSLQIREVLKLNTGSVVELDRLVSEPVEVIVNNCVIARGEVVVVDGNYGVRVIHLASREDRLRSGISEASNRLGMTAR